MQGSPSGGGEAPPPGGSSASFKQHSRSIRILRDGVGKVFFCFFFEFVLKPFSKLKESGEGIPEYNLFEID